MWWFPGGYWRVYNIQEPKKMLKDNYPHFRVELLPLNCWKGWRDGNLEHHFLFLETVPAWGSSPWCVYINIDTFFNMYILYMYIIHIEKVFMYVFRQRERGKKRFIIYNHLMIIHVIMIMAAPLGSNCEETCAVSSFARSRYSQCLSIQDVPKKDDMCSYRAKQGWYQDVSKFWTGEYTTHEFCSIPHLGRHL